jgi:hypothetical protein
VESASFEGGDIFHDFRWRQVFEKPPWRELWESEETDEDLSEDFMVYMSWRTRRGDEYRESIMEKHLSTYIDLLVEYGHIDATEDEYEWVTEHLFEGNDSLLKALLITLCPRLNVLRHASGKDDTRDLRDM